MYIYVCMPACIPAHVYFMFPDRIYKLGRAICLSTITTYLCYIYIYTHVCVCVYIQVDMYIYMYVYVYVYMYTHIDTHIHSICY